MISDYDDIFISTGDQYGVDPGLLKAIASVESGLDPDIEGDLDLANTRLGSSAGMFQFRTGTAKDYGLIDDQGNDYRKDPAKAADAAARKLVADTNYFKEKYGNSLTNEEINNLAIQAYNGGRGGVNSKATQNYLSKVLSTQGQVQLAQANIPQQTMVDIDPNASMLSNFQKIFGPQQAQTQTQTQTPSQSTITLKQLQGAFNSQGKDFGNADLNNPTDVSNTLKHTKAPPKEDQGDVDLYSEDNFGIIKSYVDTRIGIDLETKEEYIEEFLSHMRGVEWNTTFGGVPELNYIMNTSDDNVRIAAKAHELYDKMPDFHDGVIEGIGEVTFDLVTDPTNWLGVGAGAILKHKLARKGINALIKDRLEKNILKESPDLNPLEVKRRVSNEFTGLSKEMLLGEKKKAIKNLNKKAFAIGGGVEGLVAANASIIDQSIDQELERRDVGHELYVKRKQGIIDSSEYNKAYNQLIKDTELSEFEVLANAGLGLVLGGFSALIPAGAKGVAMESSADIYKQTLRGLKQTPQTKVDIDGNLKNLFVKQLSKEVENSINSDTYLRNVDFSALRVLDKYKGIKNFQKAMAEGRIVLDELTEDLKKVGQLSKSEVADEKLFKDLLTFKKVTEQGGLVKAVIEQDLYKKSLGVAFEIMVSDPDRFRKDISGYLHGEEKISNVLRKVFGRIEEGGLDEDTLGRALKSAGVTQKQFEYALSATTKNAAETLSTVASFGRAIKKYADLNPELKSLADLTFADRRIDESASMFQGFVDRIKNLERNSKALVVSSIGTTVRNIFGTSIGMTMDAAVKTLDIGTYGVYKMTSSVLGGKYRNKYIPDGDSFVENAFGQMGQLSGILGTFTPAGQRQIADQFDLILQDSFRTKNLLLNSLQEVGDKNKLWRISRAVNVGNIAQDAFFRRAIFVNSIRRQLKQGGQDLDKMLANDYKIPMNMIQNASDEALQSTFAKLPEISDAPVSGIKKLEQRTNNVVASFINFFEGFPGASLVIPFPRFMANAMAFQYKYSLFQFPKFLETTGNARRMLTTGMDELKEKIAYNKELQRKLDAGEITKAQMYGDGKYIEGLNPRLEEDLLRQQEIAANKLFYEARQELNRGIIGTGFLFSAYQYRKENQDSKWFEAKNEDGSTIDIRAIFPLAPFLALADAMVKINDPELTYDSNDIAETMESIVGQKLVPFGLSNTAANIVDMFTGEDAGSKEKVIKFVGETMGDFANRFQQPLQPFYGVLDSFDKEFQVARDPQSLTSETTPSRLYEIAMNRFMARGSAAVQYAFSEAGELAPQPVRDFFKVIVPRTKLEMPKALNMLDTTAPVRGGEFFSAIAGVRVTPKVNKIEAEFKKLGVSPWPTFAATGDREFDRMVILESYKYLVGDADLEADGVYQDTFYQSLFGNNTLARMYNEADSQSTKRILLKQYFSEAVKMGRQDAAALLELGPDGMNEKGKRYYRGLSKDYRNAIAKRYRRIHPEGKSLEETGNYREVFLLKDEIFIPFNEGFKSGVAD